ncbi:MAG: N-6 DNA methylase [Anaerolineae bacterium]|nr:N-6 DNA methylase [Anaerolineae bacterium]
MSSVTSCYEQYLGFKSLDPNAQLEIAKNKKRKSQGIYYTPQYVVRYIVSQTVGKLLQDGRDPYTLRILDPACGSGSFLIEAFDVLDRWHNQHNPDATPADRQKWRRHILTENLYGVDLDDQAVEVTRLNLMLRAALERQKLPYLTHIQHGNSLIDDDAIAGKGLGFNWTRRFESVMDAGGFDAVIGNPPYVRQEILGPAFKDYAHTHYQTYAGTADLYVYFVERGLSLLQAKGRMGYILPNKWIRAAYGKALRNYTAAHLEEMVDFGELRVFADASTFPSIIVLRPNTSERVKVAHVKTLDFNSLEGYVHTAAYHIDRVDLQQSTWTLAKTSLQTLLNKIANVGVPLGEYVNDQIYRGIVTGFNDAFVIDNATRRYLIAQDPKSAELIKPFITGREIKRYEAPKVDKYLIFTRRGLQIEDYPAIHNYLLQFKNRLMPKPHDWNAHEWEGRKAGLYQWFETQDPVEYYAEFEKPKIVYPDIAKEQRLTFDTQGLYFGNTAYFIPTDDLYLLAVLNSTLIFEYYKRIATVLGDADQGGRLRWFRQDVLKIPIRKLDLTDPSQKAQYDHIVGLVERILKLKQEHAQHSDLLSDRRHELAEEIEWVDGKINAAVYALYGLDETEIRFMESGA